MLAILMSHKSELIAILMSVLALVNEILANSPGVMANSVGHALVLLLGKLLPSPKDPQV